MDQKNFFKLWFFSFLVTCLFISLDSHGQELDEVKKLCGNVTPANKAMAKRAGYNLDELCGEVASVSKPSKPAVISLPLVERETVSSIKTNVNLETSEQDPSNSSGLKPFGYDLFANAPTTYAPAASIPVSGDYLLGPGDTLDILFFGKSNSAFSVEVNREGFVDFPELGPVGIAGLTFSEAKELLQARIAAQIIGTQVSISMGLLRSMQIFVLGEAFKPGAYTVSSLSTISNALFSSGGISDIGSLRNIQLKRQGKVVAVLDLYDLLLSGDITSDVRLQSSDVIYVATVGDMVSIEGLVLRPAIYEVKGNQTVQDLVQLAGGMKPEAFAKSARLQRINDDGYLTVIDLDLSSSSDKNMNLRGGDKLTIDSITDFKKDVISLTGAVRHGGDFSWNRGMRISDVITGREKLQNDADLTVSFLVRELPYTSDIEVMMVDIEKVLNDPSSEENIILEARDKILIISRYEDRAEILEPIISQLKLQASLNNAARLVTVSGVVRFPGEYPFVKGLTLQSLIKVSGGLLESTYSEVAEIRRMDFSDPDRAASKVNLTNLNVSIMTEIQPLDLIEFRSTPNFGEFKNLTLEGEFLFPGTYSFDQGDTLMSVIQRAGGFTNDAFLGGSIFQRESLREREQREIERIAKLLEESLQSERLKAANSNMESMDASLTEQQRLLDKLSDFEGSGRLIIPLDEITSFAVEDLVLEDNDKLFIPKFSQEISIVGEVERPASYMFKSDMTIEDYLQESGGLKLTADKKRIFIVKANGKIFKPGFSLLKFNTINEGLSAGDTVVVPKDTSERAITTLSLLGDISEIIYQLALGAAAVRSLNN
jgi:protein involved in polysaccharide export with SLBB domain